MSYCSKHNKNYSPEPECTICVREERDRLREQVALLLQTSLEEIRNTYGAIGIARHIANKALNEEMKNG